ncbi:MULTISPECIES: iron chelate uptake ABC transporter family permease subunit [Micrococcaceae]|uniref:iron chelate uptake ABC transporter family permease subunit n=1 Tax=Micrococcaceae TaxID=1268 RepID=UPI000A846BF1|nr:iron chelate uptake ABC transporter family permease subunit [Arthrobacter sp. HMSC08H08]MCG7303959.1 iron chelate uptake ABC transporter family permease subunit [Pseudoglutamicibacter albus]
MPNQHTAAHDNAAAHDKTAATQQLASASSATTLDELIAEGVKAERRDARRGWIWIAALSAGLLIAVAVFLTWDLMGALEFALKLRGTRVGAMLVCAVAIAVSTVAFQTVTANRILTPSIMGMDALYILLQTTAVFVLGGTAWMTASPLLRFGIELGLMVLFAVLLYRWMFTGRTANLHLMLLVGIVLGTLFRGISALLQKLLDPSEFTQLQDLFFASFNRVDPNLLTAAAIVVGVAVFFAWRMRHTLDAMALGRDMATSLGINHQRVTTIVLILSAVMVATCTALVGPITFFGLLVVSLAYQALPGAGHGTLFIVSSLIGAFALVVGQFIVERLAGHSTTLSVVIEFAGGIVFIALLLKGSLKS